MPRAYYERRKALHRITAFGRSPLDIIRERKAWIKAKLRKRYNKFVIRKRWTVAELDELGYNLRALIEAHDDVSEWIKRRLSW